MRAVPESLLEPEGGDMARRVRGRGKTGKAELLRTWDKQIQITRSLLAFLEKFTKILQCIDTPSRPSSAEDFLW